jgi:uncharacterized protein YcbX
MGQPELTVAAIYRYPVKGLSADALERTHVALGGAIPYDRAWAIENGSGRFDPASPAHQAKIHFLMLMRDERLAKLDCRFEEATETLTVYRGGKPVVRGQLSSPTGRLVIEQFMAAFMRGNLRGAPKIVSAPGISFSDARTKCLHIIGRASVRDLERVVGRPIDPIRFRPNIVIEGAAPWTELSWVGREIRLGSGVRLLVKERTSRCAATNVDPATGARDMDIPAVLGRKWGHTDLGVYATVVSEGPVALGDTVSITDPIAG